MMKATSPSPRELVVHLKCADVSWQSIDDVIPFLKKEFLRANQFRISESMLYLILISRTLYMLQLRLLPWQSLVGRVMLILGLQERTQSGCKAFFYALRRNI